MGDEEIARRLDELLRVTPEELLDLDTAKYVIFSDHHRGQRDAADDFQACERAYRAALGYYYEKGHTLVVLGDVEELWECRPKKVVAAYAYCLSLEAEFHKAGRYVRVWGNHDDEWQSAASVERYLGRRFPAIVVREALRFRVVARGGPLGALLLAHGHQGTMFSDRHHDLSKVVVRYVWRPLQRLLRIPSTTPATGFSARRSHDLAMYEWAQRQGKL